MNKFEKGDIVHHKEFGEYGSIVSCGEMFLESKTKQYIVIAHRDGYRCIWSEFNLDKVEDPEYEKTWLATMIKNPNWFY